jgi:hypothetical protein
MARFLSAMQNLRRHPWGRANAAKTGGRRNLAVPMQAEALDRGEEIETQKSG